MGFLSRWLARPRVRHVDAREAHRLVQDGAQLLDVRRREEVRREKPAGALHVPLHVLPRQMQRVDPGRPVVCICASGARSAAAARHLLKEGYTVHNVRGGLAAWKRAGLPVE